MLESMSSSITSVRTTKSITFGNGHFMVPKD